MDDPGFRATFGTVGGDRLKRAPTGFPPDHPDIELLKLKDVVFSCPLADADVLDRDLPATIATALAHATPVLRLLARASRRRDRCGVASRLTGVPDRRAVQ